MNLSICPSTRLLTNSIPSSSTTIPLTPKISLFPQRWRRYKSWAFGSFQTPRTKKYKWKLLNNQKKEKSTFCSAKTQSLSSPYPDIYLFQALPLQSQGSLKMPFTPVSHTNLFSQQFKLAQFALIWILYIKRSFSICT